LPNSNAYKVMFHKGSLILMFARSKRCLFASRLNDYMLFSVFNCFTHFPFNFRRARLKGDLSRLEGACRSSIMILFRILIRLKVWRPINMCL
jgi:hypothetical protein